MRPVVVFGGYGTFGTHVCRDLAARGVPLTVAGRDGTRAKAFAATLGSGSRGLAADATDPASCRVALAGHGVAVSCAGPFDRLGATLLDACLAAGCHYADIADDRGHAALVRSHGGRFRDLGLAAVYGCSSLPGISGALALLAREGVPSVERARVTLFIGNKNPKGQAAVRSLLAGLGRPIAAPQGCLRGFRGREVVLLPPPFGRRGVFDFDSPEYDLFPPLLGARSVSVKVGFELRAATYLFAWLALLGLRYGERTAQLLELPGRLLGRLGSSGGAVMAELFLPGGTARRATLLARRDGQRMAALPCALVAQALSAGEVPARGAVSAYEFLGAARLVEALVAEGFELHTS